MYYENTRGGFKNTDKTIHCHSRVFIGLIFHNSKANRFYPLLFSDRDFWSGISSFACVCILCGFSARGHPLASSIYEHSTFVYSTKHWPLHKIIHLSRVVLQNLVFLLFNSHFKYIYIYIYIYIFIPGSYSKIFSKVGRSDNGTFNKSGINTFSIYFFLFCMLLL